MSDKNTFFTKTGDTAAIRATLKRGNDPVDLTGATVRFLMNTEDLLTSIVAKAATIDNTKGGKVSYTFLTSETTKGTFLAEWEVTNADGTIETFPEEGYNVVVITDDLG